MKKPLNVPQFKNEDEEFEFWSELDFDEFFFRNGFPIDSACREKIFFTRLNRAVFPFLFF